MTLFVDLETSGLSPEHGSVILSIGMIADDGTLDSVAHELAVHVIPTDEQWAAAQPQALEVNGLTLEFLKENGLPLPNAIEKVCTWLADQRVWLGTTVVGQNPDFDYRFLRYYMLDQLAMTGFPVDRSAVNMIEMPRELMGKDKNFRLPPTESGRPSFKGSNISLALGLPPEPPIHKALAGAQACRQNYYGLLDRLSKAQRSINFR